MRLPPIIALGLAGGAVLAAVAWRYTSAYLAPLGGDTFEAALSLLGAVGGIAVLAYAVLSFALLTAGTGYDLDRVRARLARPAVDPKLLPAAWRNALAGTEFAALGTFLPGEDLAMAPLALLRVLRQEIWRSYGLRLLTTQLVTVALAAVAAAAPMFGASSPGTASASRFAGVAATLALVAGIAGLLLLDGAIRRLAVTVSRIAASWEASLRDQPAAAPRPPVRPAATPSGTDNLAVAMDRLAAGLAARAASEPLAAGSALAAIETSLRDLVARQEAVIGALAQGAGIRGTPAGEEAPGLGEAMMQLAAAVDKLADPLLRRMRVLDASDRRLLTVLRRQEEAVGSVGTKWGELVNALQAMSAGLDSFARAAASRLDREAHLLSSEPVEPGALSEELQELLDEMSEVDDIPPRRAAT